MVVFAKEMVFVDTTAVWGTELAWQHTFPKVLESHYHDRKPRELQEVQNIFGRENFQSEYKINKPAFKPSACTRDLLGGLGFSIKDYLVCLKGHCHTKTKAGAFSGSTMLKEDEFLEPIVAKLIGGTPIERKEIAFIIVSQMARQWVRMNVISKNEGQLWDYKLFFNEERSKRYRGFRDMHAIHWSGEIQAEMEESSEKEMEKVSKIHRRELGLCETIYTNTIVH